jgi:hypothetical protein
MEVCLCTECGVYEREIQMDRSPRNRILESYLRRHYVDLLTKRDNAALNMEMGRDREDKIGRIYMQKGDSEKAGGNRRPE